jgi:hypothetical protein
LIAVTANLGTDLPRSGRCISATPTPIVHAYGGTFTPENGQILENLRDVGYAGSGGATKEGLRDPEESSAETLAAFSSSNAFHQTFIYLIEETFFKYEVDYQ